MKYKGFAIGYKEKCAYVYIWFSKEYKILYVGQTNNKNSVLGRAVEHVYKDGTLRMRCLEQGIDLDEINDFILLSYELPREKRFTSIESSYRLAVEYRVQSKMHNIRGNVNPSFRIISKVTYTDYASNSQIVKIAQEIIEDFIKIYNII